MERILRHHCDRQGIALNADVLHDLLEHYLYVQALQKFKGTKQTCLRELLRALEQVQVARSDAGRSSASVAALSFGLDRPVAAREADGERSL